MRDRLGDLFVYDDNLKHVARFDQDGNWVGPFPDSSRREILRIEVDTRGNLMFLEKKDRLVTIHSPEGRLVAKIPSRAAGYELKKTVDIAIDPAGYIYLLDQDRAQVAVFDAFYRFVALLGPQELGNGAIGKPISLDVDASGISTSSMTRRRLLFASNRPEAGRARRERPKLRRIIAPVPAVAIAFSCLSTPVQLLGAQAAPPAQIDVVPIDDELFITLSSSFDEAREIFEDPQRQSQSIDFLSQIIDSVEQARRGNESASLELIELQQKALEYRARAFFNAGQQQGAGDDFRRLILDNPRYSLDAESLSPRVIDFFEDQKKQLVGYIAVTTEPAGARVTVNGEFLGITNFFPIEVHTGLARVDVELEGYDGWVSSDTDILPGEITPIDLVLERNSAKLPIITQPGDVEVIVDGESMGRTAGRLPPDLRSFMPEEFDVERLSAPFELNALPLGKHVIELRRECYEPVRFELDATEARDYTARIMKLEDSVGRLSITSSPDNANVFLDGDSVGTTPLTLDRVCSGEHYLEVKHPSGKYFENIVVGRDEALSFECAIRPSLAFLGLMTEPDVSERDAADIRARMEESLAGLEGMNLVNPRPAELRSIVGGDGVSALLPSSEEDSLARRDLTQKLGEELEVEAILIGFVPAQRLTKDVVLYFYGVGSPRPDSTRLNYLGSRRASDFRGRPLRPHPAAPQLDRGDQHRYSYGGSPDCGGRRSGRPLGPSGDRGRGSHRKRQRQTGRHDPRCAQGSGGHRSRGALVLSVWRGGAEQTKNLTVGSTPIEIPLNERGFMYNRTIVDLRQRMARDPEVESLAHLNLGLAFIQLGDFETALKDHLPLASLPASRGISQGTVLYYTGLAYLRLGERGDAARNFQQALQFPEASVQSNDGPKVRPLIQRHLRAMGQQ